MKNASVQDVQGSTDFVGFELDQVDAKDKSITLTLGVGAASLVAFALYKATQMSECKNPGMAYAISQRLKTFISHVFKNVPLEDENGAPICRFYIDNNGVEIDTQPKKTV